MGNKGAKGEKGGKGKEKEKGGKKASSSAASAKPSSGESKFNFASKDLEAIPEKALTSGALEELFFNGNKLRYQSLIINHFTKR